MSRRQSPTKPSGIAPSAARLQRFRLHLQEHLHVRRQGQRQHHVDADAVTAPLARRRSAERARRLLARARSRRSRSGPAGSPCPNRCSRRNRRRAGTEARPHEAERRPAVRCASRASRSSSVIRASGPSGDRLRVVHEDVDRAELLDAALHARLDVIGRTHVAAHGHRGAALRRGSSIAVRSTFDAVRPATTTAAPLAASSSAIPSPTPCPAPVTIAALPSNDTLMPARSCRPRRSGRCGSP